jgi:hypothetical protein
MKYFLKVALVLSLLSGSVFADSPKEQLDVYVGLSKHVVLSKFRKEKQTGLFNKLRRDGDFYLGFKVADDFSIEGGYESTLIRTIKSKLTREQCPDLHVIRHIPDGKVPLCITKLKIKGPYIGVVYFHQLGETPVSLLGSVGISLIKASAQCGPAPKLNYLAISGTEFNHSRTSEAFRFMGGTQYLMDSGLGFRGTVSAISSKKIVFRNFNGSSVDVPRIKMRDSLVCGLGAFWLF